jgi:DNA-binding CsgD family transcriptional regulator
MIRHLCLIRTGEHGSEQQSTHIIANNRELYKDIGSPWDITGHLLKHLISMPDEFTVEITISGSKPAIHAVNDCINGLHTADNFLHPMPRLTTCEIYVLDLLNQGKSEKEISEIKSVNYQSVLNMCCGMHKKFHCHSNGEMIASARRLRLVN